MAVSVDAREEALAVVRDGAGAQAGPAPALLRAQPRRAHRAHRRPDAAAAGRRPLATSRRGAAGSRACGCSGSTGSTTSRCSTSRPPRRRRRTSATSTRRLPARAAARRPSGCGWPAPPAGSPTTTRSTRSTAGRRPAGRPRRHRAHRGPRLGPPPGRLARRRGAGRRAGRAGRPGGRRRPRRAGALRRRTAPARAPVRVGPCCSWSCGSSSSSSRWSSSASLAYGLLGAAGRLRREIEGAERDAARRSSSSCRRPRPRAEAARRRATGPNREVRGRPTARNAGIRALSGVASPLPPTPGGPVMSTRPAGDRPDHPGDPAALRLQEAAGRLALARPLAAHLQGRDEGHEGRRRPRGSAPRTPPRPPPSRGEIVAPTTTATPATGDLTAQLHEEARIAEARAAELRARAPSSPARPTAPR